MHSIIEIFLKNKNTLQLLDRNSYLQAVCDVSHMNNRA